MFQALNLPRAELKLVRKNEQVFVWCIIRKKQLLLTPEEWVRQHIIHFLIFEKRVPIALIAAEMAIEVNKLSRRCDIVVFGKDAKPLLIIECKAPEVAITEKVFNQIAQYNFNLNVDLLMMTNGIDHVICSIDREKHAFSYLQDLPVWEEGL